MYKRQEERKDIVLRILQEVAEHAAGFRSIVTAFAERTQCTMVLYHMDTAPVSYTHLPDTLFLNYTNPMAILSGYMQRYSKIRTVGLCHSVQVCTEGLLKGLGMEDKLEAVSYTHLIMGHSDIGVTLNAYTHLDFEDIEKEMKEVCSRQVVKLQKVV